MKLLLVRLTFQGTLILGAISLISVSTIINVKVEAFQVAPDPNTAYRNAIEKATNQPIIANLPVDDNTYKCQVPCPFSQTGGGGGIMSSSSSSSAVADTDGKMFDFDVDVNYVKTLPVDSKVGLSDSLRTRFFMREMIRVKGDGRPPVALPLSQSGVTSKLIPPRRNGIARTVIGLDNSPAEYWFDNRIHTFGNTGPWGGVHALMAPLATKLIDDAAYKGIDARTIVTKDLRKHLGKPDACVLDLCCGVGMSTRALSENFPDASFICGVDTSPEMLSMARFISKYQKVLNILQNFKVRKNIVTDIVKMIVEIQIVLSPWDMYSKQNLAYPVYARGNAERVKVPGKSFDLVTIMYAFHEIPKTARYRILREARRLLKDGGKLAVVDISEDFVPPPSMLAGEPYVLEYQQNIMEQMESIQGFGDKESVSVVPGHVHMWLLTRSSDRTKSE